MKIQTQKSGDNSLSLQAENIEVNYETHIHNTIQDINSSDNDNAKKVLTLIEQNKLEEAELEIDKINNEIHLNISKDLIKVADLYTLVNPKKAEKSYKRASALTPNDARILNINALYLMNIGKTSQAVELFNKAIKYAKDGKTKNKIIGNISILYKNTGQVDKAIKLLTQSIDDCNKNNYKIEKIKHINNLGSCFYNNENASKADKILLKALDEAKLLDSELKSHDDKKELKSVKSNILTNLAITYRHLFLKTSDATYLDKAIQRLETAIDIGELLDDKSILGRHFGNLANIYRLQGNHTESRKYIEKALSCFTEFGSLKDEMTSLMNLGLSYYDEADYKQAIHYYEICINKDVSESFSRIHAMTSECLAYAYRELGDEDKERHFSRKAAKYYKKLNLNDFYCNITKEFSYLESTL